VRQAHPECLRFAAVTKGGLRAWPRLDEFAAHWDDLDRLEQLAAMGRPRAFERVEDPLLEEHKQLLRGYEWTEAILMRDPRRAYLMGFKPVQGPGALERRPKGLEDPFSLKRLPRPAMNSRHGMEGEGAGEGEEGDVDKMVAFLKQRTLAQREADRPSRDDIPGMIEYAKNMKRMNSIADMAKDAATSPERAYAYGAEKRALPPFSFDPESKSETM
jgi:hypothetical protein